MANHANPWVDEMPSGSHKIDPPRIVASSCVTMRLYLPLFALTLALAQAKHLRQIPIKVKPGYRKLKGSKSVAFDAVVNTLEDEYDACETTTEGKQTIVTCTDKDSKAIFTADGSKPKELKICKTGGKGGKEGKCKTYKFGNNPDDVLNKVFPGSLWDMVVDAMEDKFGSKECDEVSTSPVTIECEKQKKGDEFARLVAESGKSKSLTPDTLEVCDKKGCDDYDFNEDKSAYEIVQDAF